MINQNKKTNFINVLSRWGREHRRDFSWRLERDSFRTLVAEILLQRSRAKTVAPVYQELFRRWPTPKALAEARLCEIVGVISPLGLMRRASTIQALSRVVHELGMIPESIEELMRLPGVGRYVASATMICAFDESHPLVDSVTARVYRRFFGLNPNPNRVDDELWKLVAEVTPQKGVRELTWAILDLAATLCLPKVPHCGLCPIFQWCERTGVLV